MHLRKLVTIPLVLLIVAGCAGVSTTNIKKQPAASKATFDVSTERGREDNALVILALSGGGSRAAYLSTSVMFRLSELFDDIDLLAEVDAMSSVSGGSLPAAYYAISTDPGAATAGYGREWDEREVKALMQHNYIARWFGNWFWPHNIVRYWFTDFDRTDIMAQTFADNLYDTEPGGRDLTIGDLRADRPYLILNATNGTSGRFGEPFTFTSESFDQLNSDINAYSLSRAVMASASFPAVFNYMTLRNHHEGISADDEFTHVFDGGNFDNLGLESVLGILSTLERRGRKYDRLVVILIDAYAESGGVSGRKSDSRKLTDFIVDTNFIDATDSLLKANRERVLKNFSSNFSNYLPNSGKAIFYHIKFADVADTDLQRDLNRIKTDFRIDPKDAERIDQAVKTLLSPENTCLIAIRKLLIAGSNVQRDCTFSG